MIKHIVTCLALVMASFRLAEAEAPSSPPAAPRVFLLDAAQLLETRQRLRGANPRLQGAVEQLKQDGQRALAAGPFSVVSKEATPPSGDKHDYMSLAPYWWPNPNTPDGLPYIRRDGERNPEIFKVRNRLDLGEMVDAVEALALSFYFTGDEAHAAHAVKMLRTWYLDPATRMNPNFNYAQAIRGIDTGRGAGLIEARSFVRIVDAAGLLAGSTAWTAKDQRELGSWFADFVTWMRESKLGRDEAEADNNHGTYYDVQIVSYALWLGKPDEARNVLKTVGERRIAAQVEPDGRQPLELARTKAWSYSVGNLAGLMALARLGEHVDVNLWEFQTDDGRSIRAALDFLAPYGLGDKEWPYPQINGFSAELIYPLLRQAALKYPDKPFQEQLAKLPPRDATNRNQLLLSPLEPISQLHVR